MPKPPLKRRELLTSAIASAPMAAATPHDPIESHRYADSVLLPRFTAAFNAWTYEHPSDAEHARKFDRKDQMRWQAVVKAWKELHEAMERAGYG